MKTVTSILFLLWLQATPVAANQESKIKLQITSIDAHLADTAHPHKAIDDEENPWLTKTEQSLLNLMRNHNALAERLKNAQHRRSLLQTIYYEAKRAGLDPDLVLAVIRVESNFRKYAISSVGARGYMQVMGWWASIVGETSSDLFNLRTNIRLGCAILRSYLDQEHGNVQRALARYNGSVGKIKYPNLIYAAWQ